MSMLHNLIAIRIAGKIEDLKLKYPEISEEIDEFSSRDPSKKNKYVEWAVKQLVQQNKIQDIIPTIDLFDKNKNRLKNQDINSYDLKELESELKELPNSKRQERTEAKASGSTKLYEDEQFLFIRINSKRACIEYGKGTKWCITMEDSSYYEEYTNKNVVFYFLINKSTDTDNNTYKIAYAVQRDEKNQIIIIEMFDSADDVISTNPHKSVSGKIDQIIRSDAPKVPMSTITKLENGLISKSELIDLVSEEKDETTRQYIAKNKNTPPEALARLAYDDNYDVCSLVAQNPNTSPETLVLLAKNKDGTVRYWVARNPNTSVATLALLAKDKDVNVRYRVAQNRKTPPASLALLAKDKNAYIRCNVAGNRETPPEILALLAKDEFWSVLHRVAGNPNTSQEDLALLATNENKLVREQVAHNINTSADTLILLGEGIH